MIAPTNVPPVPIPYPNIRASATALELWRGERCLFDDLTFESKAPVLHVRGANGSGKTTLLKVLCGLTTVERGDVLWTRDGVSLRSEETRGLLAYAGHQDALNPALSAAENLAWGVGLYRSVSPDEIEQRMRQEGLESLLPLPAGKLSAGQKRRVSLMRSVCSDTPVWLWDEPYANLDASGVDWVNGLIDAHVANGGCLILSAHQSPTIDPGLVQVLELSQ